MRTVRILLPVVLAVTLLGACGGGARDEAAASTTVPPSSSSTGSTTTVGSVPTSELADSGTVEIPDDAVDMTGRELVTVVIEDNVFIERSIVVSAGTEVMWVNKGRNPHNVTPSEEGSFEPLATAVFNGGGSGSRVFDTGTFAYYCSIHGSPNRGQRGTVYVVP